MNTNLIDKGLAKCKTVIESAAQHLEEFAATSPKTVLCVGALIGVSAAVSSLVAAYHLLPLIVEWVSVSAWLVLKLAVIAFTGTVAYLAVRVSKVAYRKSAKLISSPAPTTPSA